MRKKEEISKGEEQKRGKVDRGNKYEERACNTELTVKNNSEDGCAGSQNVTCVVHIQTSRNLF